VASIRTRITATYALALVATMVAFSLVLWSERERVAELDLQARATYTADLASRILDQMGTENQTVRIVRGDSVAGLELTPRFKALLDALPDYVIITDSTRTIYASMAVRKLSPADSSLLLQGVRGVTPRQAAKVRLDSADQVLLVGQRVPSRLGVSVRNVVAGVPTASLDLASQQVFEVLFLFGPIFLIVSVVTAWAIGGRLIVPIERMVYDLEAITDGRSLHRRMPIDETGDEISRLGDTINAMVERLEASFAALRRFTADASHELKTPLTVLRVDLERAMTAPSGSTEQLVALEEALNEAARMANLVESLLTLARADEGRFDLHREPVPLEPLVRDVAETALILGEDAAITVTVGAVQPVTVSGDQVRLRQLFLNMVTNAIKYTAAGGAVDLSLELRDGTAVFTVKDTGIGIAGADLPFIFDRFWRVDRARSRGERAGVGLGLAISQWIAHAHGGSISVSSRMGRGSTFAVTIPAIVANHEHAATRD
jgi:two-component system OmpR family sensor kinase